MTSPWRDVAAPTPSESFAVESIKSTAFVAAPDPFWTPTTGGTDAQWLALLAESVEAPDGRYITFRHNNDGGCVPKTGVIRFGGFSLGAGRSVRKNPAANSVRLALGAFGGACFVFDCDVKVYDGVTRELIAASLGIVPTIAATGLTLVTIPIVYGLMLDTSGAHLEVELTARTQADFASPSEVFIDALEWKVETHTSRWRDV